MSPDNDHSKNNQTDYDQQDTLIGQYKKGINVEIECVHYNPMSNNNHKQGIVTR